MNQSKQLTEGALLTALYSILLVIALFFPFTFIIILFLLPVPFIIFASRFDWKPALLMGVAALLVSAIITAGAALPITFIAAVGGIAAGVLIHKGYSAYETWAMGTIGFATGFVGVYAFIQLVLNINITKMFDDTIQQTLDTLESVGIQSIMSEDVYETFTEQFMMLKDLVPAGIVLMSIFVAFIAQFISYIIMNRINRTQLHYPPFRTFNLPKSVIWIYFIALILTFFDIDEQSFLYIGIMNVILLITLLLTIQGFSLIFCYAHVKKWSKAIPVLSVVLGIVLPVLFYLVRIIGIIDLGFSVKQRLTGGEK